MAREDRELIAKFAADLRLLVRDGLDLYSEHLGGQLYDDLVTLWSLQESRFTELHVLLSGDLEAAGRFPVDPRDPRWPSLDEQLAAAGLTGSELRVKVALFEEAASGYAERRTPTRFATTLAAADILLGSLCAVVPPLEPAKEAKETIEFIFSWGRGWVRTRFRRRGNA